MPNWGLDDFDTPAEPAAGRRASRENVPEGDHAFQIREVINHGEKVEIRLAHDDQRFGWVFASPPVEQDWGKRVLSSLRTSLGITREEWAAMEITDLVGRRVRARIYHKPGKTGGVFVNVGEFLPVAQAQAVERAVAPPSARTPVVPKRSPTQKADAVGHDPDDIPF